MGRPVLYEMREHERLLRTQQLPPAGLAARPEQLPPVDPPDIAPAGGSSVSFLLHSGYKLGGGRGGALVEAGGF